MEEERKKKGGGNEGWLERKGENEVSREKVKEEEEAGLIGKTAK